MKTPIEFKRFTKLEYPEYKRWFEDKQLQRALGYVDDEWLEHILHDDEGLQYAFLLNGELVGVVGIACPLHQEGYYVITDMAIKPALRNTGLGSKLLWRLLEEVKLKADEYWVCYVERFNVGAQLFFEKHGWYKVEEEDMIQYEYRIKGGYIGLGHQR